MDFEKENKSVCNYKIVLNNKMEEICVPKQKKPRKEKRVLTFYERIKVILEYQNSANPSARILSEKYGCGKTQILNILRNKKEYLEQWVNASPQHPRRPSGLFISLGVICNEWINRAKAYSRHITNEDIRKTAKEIAKVLNIASFHPSNRWLERFKTKYQIDDESLITDPIYALFLERKSLRIVDIIIDIKNILSPDCLVPIYGRKPGSGSKHKSSRSIKQDPTEKIEVPLPIITSITSISDQRQQHRRSLIGDETTSSAAASIEDTEETQNSNDASDAIECVDITSDDDNDNNYDNSNDVSSHLMMTMNDDDEETGQEEEQEENNGYIEQFELLTYSHALEHLKSLEQFALLREDLRAVGLINQLENYFKEKMSQEEEVS